MFKGPHALAPGTPIRLLLSHYCLQEVMHTTTAMPHTVCALSARMYRSARSYPLKILKSVSETPEGVRMPTSEMTKLMRSGVV